MKRVLFITSIASPYRVQFFDSLGKDMEVTVLLHDLGAQHTGRAAAWFEEGKGGFRTVQLTKRIATVGGENLCTDVLAWVKKPFDAIVVCGYSSPTVMLAMAYMRLKKIPFYMEVDGGLIREESKAKYRFKKTLVSAASGWISSGKETTKFLVHYGAKREQVYEYPFSSLGEQDILKEPISQEEKQSLRAGLGSCGEDADRSRDLYRGRRTHRGIPTDAEGQKAS